MNRKRAVLLFGIFLLFFALTSVSYTSAAPGSNPLFATIEYVQELFQKNQSDLEFLRERVSSLEEAKNKIVVYDAEDQRLGIFMEGSGENYQIFLEEQEKVIYLDEKNLTRRIADVWFLQDNCQGAPYVSVDRNERANDILSIGPEYYLFIDPFVQREEVSVLSRWEYNSEFDQVECKSITSPDNVKFLYEAQITDLPFHEPINLPVILRHE